MKPTKTTILDRWLTAMRMPGLYKQVRNRYCDEHGFCGLGVLADDAGYLTEERRAAYARYLTHGCMATADGVAALHINDGVMALVRQAMRQQGLYEKHAQFVMHAVPSWNDTDGASLPEIADRLEALVAAFKADPKAEPVVAYLRMGSAKAAKAMETA